MNRVAINEGILQWALDRTDLTADDVRQKFPKIHEWLSGESQPTFKQLESFAKKTLTPFGFFFLARSCFFMTK